MKRSASPSLGDLGVKSECKAEDMEQTPPVEKKSMPDLNSNGRNLVIRLLIPSDAAGYIIGKGGSTINKLRNESNTSILVPNAPGPERVVIITSSDHEANLNTLVKIIPLIQVKTEDYEINNKGYSSGIRLLLFSWQVGAVIGKGGETIMSLRRETGAAIKVYEECCPYSSERVVEVSGTLDTITSALKEILRISISFSPHGRVSQSYYDPGKNFPDPGCAAYMYGGFDTNPKFNVGRSYERTGINSSTIRRGREMGKPRNCLSPSSIWIRGVRGGGRRNVPQPQMTAGLQEQPNQHDKPPGLFGGYNESYYEPELLIESQQVTIPNEFAGAIIGLHGQRIRKVRSESGADITISETISGVPERIITITGTIYQIRWAQHLLQQCVKNFAAEFTTEED